MKKEDKLTKDVNSLMDILYPMTQDVELLTAIVCGVHDDDLKEFTDLLIENKNELKEQSDLLEILVWFRNYKNYKDDNDEE